MKIKLFPHITLAAIAIGLVSIPLLGQLSNVKMVEKEASKSDPVTNGVSFSCGEIPHKDTGENIPATVAYVPQRDAHVPIIAWTVNYFPKWDVQTRCETVSPKFQNFYKNGHLHYLTTGIKNGYDIICATKQKGQPCRDDAQLFQIKAQDDPQEALKGLIGILEGSSSKPIYQTSGGKVYVSIASLLKVAPAIEENKLTSN